MFRRLPIWQACSTVRTAVARPQCLASRLRLFHSSAVLRKTHYEALEVSETADAASIKKAFYQKVRLYHPDVSPGNKENQKKFVEVSDAYQVLRDPDQRRQYDASLRGSPFGFGAGAGRPGPSSPYGYGGEWPFQQGGGGNFSNEDFMRMYRDMFGDVFEEVQRATRNSRHRPEYGPRSYSTRGANGVHFEFHYYGGGPGGGRAFDFGPNMGGGPGMSLGQLLRAMSGSRKAFESLFGTKTYTATPGKNASQSEGSAKAAKAPSSPKDQRKKMAKAMRKAEAKMEAAMREDAAGWARQEAIEDIYESGAWRGVRLKERSARTGRKMPKPPRPASNPRFGGDPWDVFESASGAGERTSSSGRRRGNAQGSAKAESGKGYSAGYWAQSADAWDDDTDLVDTRRPLNFRGEKKKKRGRR